MIAGAPILPAGVAGLPGAEPQSASPPCLSSHRAGPPPRNPHQASSLLYPQLCSSAELPEPASGVTLKAAEVPKSPHGEK